MVSMIESMAFVPPEKAHPIHNECLNFVYNIVNGEGNSISLIYLKDDDIAAPTIIYSHGNAEDMGSASNRAVEIKKHVKCSVICYEYFGYSYSVIRNGKNNYPSENGCYESINLVYDFIKNKNPKTNIILMGFSIGTGPTVNLACIKPVSGVILISGFRSIIKTKVDNFLYSILPFRDIFNNESKIGLLNMPILLIHGTEDNVVNITNSFVLLSKINKHSYYKPYWVEGAGHNNIFMYKGVNEIVKKFVNYSNVKICYLV